LCGGAGTKPCRWRAFDVPCRRRIGVRSGEPTGARDVFESFHDARVKVPFEPIIEAVTDGPK
jgi:hypothetical protein